MNCRSSVQQVSEPGAGFFITGCSSVRRRTSGSVSLVHRLLRPRRKATFADDYRTFQKWSAAQGPQRGPVSVNTGAAITAEMGIEGIGPRTCKVNYPAASFPADRVGRASNCGPDEVWT